MPNLWNITAYPSYCEGAQNTYNSLWLCKII